MTRDAMMQPIGADAPCGPDLMAADDDDYTLCVFDSEGRLPADYFDLRSETVFEPDKTRLAEDLKRIASLLRRSRDLRLLVLQAKWQILAGSFTDFSSSVILIADLLEAWPEAVHPQMLEDEIDRQNVLEELDTFAHVAAPLEQARLLEDRRIGTVTLRGYATGLGLRPLRPGEVAGEASSLVGALGNSENAEAVDALMARVEAVIAALQRIQRLCAGDGRFPFTPKFDRTLERLGEIRDLVLHARSDLQAPAAGAGQDVDSDAPSGGEGAPPPVAVAGTVSAAAPGTIGSQGAARVALQAAERHLARHEPASLALILVTQARLLIGRPLIEALEMLLEREVDEAMVDFGSQKGFRISISRLRSLTEEVVVPHGSDPAEDEAPPPEVGSRDQVGLVLKAVEDFYRRAEPSSPIPILLFKARNLLGKDFHGILRELLPPASDS